MLEQIVIILISAFVGYGAKYFWDRQSFLYKRRLKAVEKLREAVGILAQGYILYSQMRILDFKKIEASDELKKDNIQKTLNVLQVEQTIKRLSNELKALNIQNDIHPYIPEKIQDVFNAYMLVFETAVDFLSFTPYCLDYIRKDRIKERIIKNIIPVMPEREEFIKEDPVIKIFHIEDLIRKKLLKAIEETAPKKKNQLKRISF